MKKLLLMFTAVGVLFTACNKETDHNNVKHDHSADIVGTWTCLTADYAEALIINADGSAVSYGVENGEYWENVRGSVIVDGDNITMNFEDNDNLTGHFDIIPNREFSLYEDSGERYVYQCCANDLADEIIGMWVCNDSKMDAENDMMIQTFEANGKTTLTGFLPMGDNPEFVLGDNTDYKVVGDLIFLAIPANFVGGDKPKYIAERLIYTPKATALGDVMIFTNYSSDNNELLSESWLRIKQTLDLTGKTYDYKSAYVTNAKGKDEDFTIMGNTFNIDKIKAYDFDKMFGGDLFCVELNANSFKYKLRLDNGQETGFDTPMTTDGNKVTLDMNAINPALRKVEMYMFQDANDTQVHIYMHTDAFINYFANMEVYTLVLEGKIDPTDTAAIEKVFADMEARVESINVSFVMKARK